MINFFCYLLNTVFKQQKMFPSLKKTSLCIFPFIPEESTICTSHPSLPCFVPKTEDF